MDLKRPVPVWLFITGLIFVSSVTAGVLVLPRFLVPRADFAVYVSPSSATVRPDPSLNSPLFGGANASESLVEVKSLNGFKGSVSLSVTSPSGVQARLEENTILLGSDAAMFGLNVTTRMVVATTTLGNYSVTVVATSGSLSHSSILAVASQDIGIRINPTSISIAQGSSTVSTIAISSLNGFTGNLSLTATPLFIEPDPLYYARGQVNASLSTPGVLISPSSSSNVLVRITAGDFARPTSYNFSIATVSGRFTLNQRISVSVTLAPELPPILVRYSFNSNTNATLVLRNQGPAAIQISSYNVTDSAGNSVNACLRLYPRQMVLCYASVIIDAGGTSALNVITNPQCDRCNLHGSPFSFQMGQSYTVTVTTTRQNTFTFRITR